MVCFLPDRRQRPSDPLSYFLCSAIRVKFPEQLDFIFRPCQPGFLLGFSFSHVRDSMRFELKRQRIAVCCLARYEVGNPFYSRSRIGCKQFTRERFLSHGRNSYSLVGLHRFFSLSATRPQCSHLNWGLLVSFWKRCSSSRWRPWDTI